jgi:hypothetical protein
MQSGVWNPIVQIFSLFGPYTLRTLQIETLLYVYLSGVGMFFLAKYLIKNWKISLLAASCFMLCGFNTDSAQFLNWISAASFLPFCFLYYYRTITEKSWKPALLFALFFYLLFTTAYPADFILSSYIILFLLVSTIWKKQNRTKDVLISQFRLHLLILCCFVLVALPAIISFAEFLKYSERGAGASYEDVMSNPLNPGLILSYVTPLPIWKASFASVTDPLERNSFFGLIGFALLLAAFFIKTDNSLLRFCKWAFLLTLLFSFGEFGGLRIITYYILPLMNTFRHPANAKLFTIFFSCILAAFALKRLSEQQNRLNIKPVFIILTLSFIGLGIWAVAGNLSIFSRRVDANTGAVKGLIDSLSFSDLLLANVLIELPFLIALYFFLIRKLNLNLLLVTAVLNSLIHTMLFQPFTVVKKDSVAAIQSVLNSIQQKGYPHPDLKSTLADNSADGDKYFAEIGAANMYSKKIGRIDYRITPSNLLTQNEFWFNEKLRNHFMTYPLFYRADSALLIKDSASLSSTVRNLVVVSDPAIQQSINSTVPASYSVTIKKFTPNEWRLAIDPKEPSFFTLFQSFYPRWRLSIDGQPCRIEKVNISFMGFQLPAGKHSVILKYHSTDLRLAWFVSLFTTIALILIVLSLPKYTRLKTPS